MNSDEIYRLKQERKDKEYAYVSAWEYTGEPGDAILHKEELEFKDIELKTHSYK